jgi:ketosteroid isomerase-like protein
MSTTWEQDVMAREEQNRAAFLAVDLAALDRLWTDDFSVNSPHNVVGDKRRTLALLESGRIRHTSVTAEIEHLASHGEVAVVMGREQVLDRPEGTIVHRRFTNLWRLEDGSWRCFARHANVVPREPVA